MTALSHSEGRRFKSGRTRILPARPPRGKVKYFTILLFSKMLNKTDVAILDFLTRAHAAGKPARVEEVAAALRVTQGLVSQRLRRMEREGFVARTQKAVPEGRIVHYLPLPWASVRWSSPREGAFLQWFSNGEVNWEFPLVSQVQDEAAKTTLYAFLERLRSDGMLDARRGFKPAWSKLKESDQNGLTLVLYGSTARGQARSGADVDLICFHREVRKERIARIQDLAADTSLEAPRPIQLAPVHWDDRKRQLPSQILAALEQDGFVVYDGLRDRPGGARIGIWRMTHGGRRK